MSIALVKNYRSVKVYVGEIAFKNLRQVCLYLRQKLLMNIFLGLICISNNEQKKDFLVK